MTPILQTLIPLVTSYGTHKAVQFLEGAEELALADDDLTSFLARRAVEWDQLETADQDSLRDAYLEAIKRECARRLTNIPTTDHYTVSDGKALIDAQGLQYQTRIYTPESTSPASSPVPSPLVPEVVKAAQEGSVCEVEPLGESDYVDLVRRLKERADGLYCLGIKMGMNDPLTKGWEAKVKSGKFGQPEFDAYGKMSRYFGGHEAIHIALKDFVPSSKLPSSPPSSEDKEPCISIGYLEPVQYEIIKELCRSFHLLGAPIGMQAALGSWGDTLTDEEVLELLQAENAQASTTPQKGGQES